MTVMIRSIIIDLQGIFLSFQGYMKRSASFVERLGTGRRKKTRETNQCSDLHADKTLRDVAMERQDGKILAFVSRDLVAAEGYYHRSFYRDYTRQTVPRESTVLEEQDAEAIYKKR